MKNMIEIEEIKFLVGNEKIPVYAIVRQGKIAFSSKGLSFEELSEVNKLAIELVKKALNHDSQI